MVTKRIGRPPLPPEERRSKPLYLRLTPGEHEELHRLAAAEGLSTNEWLRKWILAVKGAAQEGLMNPLHRKH